MFAADYFAARDAFRHAAKGCLSSLELDARGPQGEQLTIDIAWLGDSEPRWLLLVSSGIHGVEGFAGSAVQCAFLAAAPSAPPGCAIALIHALNPWGFARLRRANENNVDLNRNFLRLGESYSGAPPKYRALDAFLNPKTAPSADGYYLRAGIHVLHHGVGELRKTIAGGQYEFERGLFFGGHRLEQGPELYLRWLGSHCVGVKRLLAIDLHTGLGPFAAMNVFSEQHALAALTENLAKVLRMPIVRGGSLDDGSGYFARGAMSGMLSQVLPATEIDALTAEFGTYSGVRVLHALREENRWHHYGHGTLDHPAKQRLLMAFRPDSPAWREAVIAQGTELLHRGLAMLSTD